jgi:hypothetical protein
MRTFNDMSGNLYTAAWAYGSLIAHLMATFRAFDDHLSNVRL